VQVVGVQQRAVDVEQHAGSEVRGIGHLVTVPAVVRLRATA
jgi:hypothetical protein